MMQVRVDLTLGTALIRTDCDAVSGTATETTTTIAVLMSVTKQECGESKGLSTGAIVGIAVGGAIALVILIVVVLVIGWAYEAAWARCLLRGKKKTRRPNQLGVYEPDYM